MLGGCVHGARWVDPGERIIQPRKQPRSMLHLLQGSAVGKGQANPVPFGCFIGHRPACQVALEYNASKCSFCPDTDTGNRMLVDQVARGV